MQILYDFKISLTKYVKLGRDNYFPSFESCPQCKAKVKLTKHGFYWRYINLIKQAVKVPICRYFCPSCHKTISLLPTFLLPYFQLPLRVIIKLIQSIALGKKILLEMKYQYLQFVKKRFMNNLNWIEAFFRDEGYRGFIKQEQKEKAMKILGFYNKCWGNKRGKQEKKKNKRAYPKTKPVINPYHTRRYIGYAL